VGRSFADCKIYWKEVKCLFFFQKAICRNTAEIQLFIVFNIKILELVRKTTILLNFDEFKIKLRNIWKRTFSTILLPVSIIMKAKNHLQKIPDKWFFGALHGRIQRF
jgi:hypothetical protein